VTSNFEVEQTNLQTNWNSFVALKKDLLINWFPWRILEPVELQATLIVV
jgi:hypothetical protein